MKTILSEYSVLLLLAKTKTTTTEMFLFIQIKYKYYMEIRNGIELETSIHFCWSTKIEINGIILNI